MTPLRTVTKNNEKEEVQSENSKHERILEFNETNRNGYGCNCQIY